MLVAQQCYTLEFFYAYRYPHWTKDFWHLLYALPRAEGLDTHRRQATNPLLTPNEGCQRSEETILPPLV